MSVTLGDKRKRKSTIVAFRVAVGGKRSWKEQSPGKSLQNFEVVFFFPFLLPKKKTNKIEFFVKICEVKSQNVFCFRLLKGSWSPKKTFRSKLVKKASVDTTTTKKGTLLPVFSCLENRSNKKTWTGISIPIYILVFASSIFFSNFLCENQKNLLNLNQWKRKKAKMLPTIREFCNVLLNFVCEFRNFTCFSEFTFHKVFLVVT